MQRLRLGLELHDLVPEDGHLSLNAVDRLALFEDLVGLTGHGKGSKLQALVNDDSMPLAIQLESAKPHEAKITPVLLDLVDKCQTWSSRTGPTA